MKRNYPLCFGWIILSLLVGACHNAKDRIPEQSLHSEKSIKDGNFIKATFDTVDIKNNKLMPVKEVRYYVNGDTLFTTEKYHGVLVFYAPMESDSITSAKFISFDKVNEPNKDGWYYVTFSNVDNFQKFPNTRVHRIVLRGYYDVHPDSCVKQSLDAILFNGSKYSTQDEKIRVMNSELQKLNKYFYK